MHTDTDDRADLVPIGEAARILGVSVDTLRRWEKDGVLIPARTLKGHRRYSRADLAERMAERAS